MNTFTMSLSLLLLLLVYSTQATHFFGTVMTYYPGDTHSDQPFVVNFRYKMNFHECNQSDIWGCFTYNCLQSTYILNVVEVVKKESSGEWCQTEGHMIKQYSSDAPFEVVLDGGNWIDGIVNGIVSWRAVALVELRNRSDTGKANSSPQTTIIPAVRVPSNCARDFVLLAFDPDGDVVKCRNGNESLSECNPCTPPSVLSLTPSCTLSFRPTDSSNEGPYAVQLVMEDFPRQNITLTQTDGTQTNLTTNNAIGKIPVQFVLRVDPPVPSCTKGLFLPLFLPPTPANGAQLYTPVGQTLEISIKAEATNSTISELLYSGPYTIFQNKTGPGEFILSWTPSESEAGESYPICYVVQALFGVVKYHSDLRCVIVTVENVYVAALSGRISFSLPFTADNVNSVIIQKIKEEVEKRGLPPDASLRLVRGDQVLTTTTAPSYG
ncbi:hypothetical protein ACER0C_001348 [Sarotherodon galilaeus]